MSPRLRLARSSLVVALCATALIARAEPGEARPWLGIAIGQGAHGVAVKGVYEGSPAAAAGVRVGEEILAVDATPTPSPPELVAAVHTAGVGTRVTLKVASPSGATRAVRVDLQVMPTEEALVQASLLDKPAPDFALATATGPLAPVSLTSLHGEVVLLDFWATWCGYCVASLPTVEQWHEAYEKQGLRVVGVTDEKLDLATAFVRRLGIRYTIASDVGHEAIDRYRVMALPMMVLIDREGIVRRVGLGAGRDELADTELAIRALLGPVARPR